MTGRFGGAPIAWDADERCVHWCDVVEDDLMDAFN